MEYIVSKAKVFVDGTFVSSDILIRDGIIVDISRSVPSRGVTVYSFPNCFVFPGLIDVHVHLRVPGFSYKEDMESGTRAAAHGGFTDVCTMPNLNPVPDSVEHLHLQLEEIRKHACIGVHPFGALTVGEQGKTFSDMEGMAPSIIGYSDDGKGIQSEEMMREAMRKIESLGKILSAHCEDEALVRGGYIHDGAYARAHGHKGICSESEWGPVKRDIELIRQTNCPYHVCHISAKETVELIRQAKAEGLNITCETGPHYLIFRDTDLQEDGRFKMNPPIRGEEDRQALIRGLCDGTIDMIATDHAPHSAEEKGKGLAGSMMGIVGIETSFPLMYTHFVKTGILSLERLIELMSLNPGRRFGIERKIAVGERANLTVFDLDHSYVIRPEEFLSKGKASPFIGQEVYGACLFTVADGRIAWQENKQGNN